MIKKFWIVALLLAAVVVGGGGCMSTQKQPETKPAQNANELALLHMQEKYGEEFTYGAPWGNSMTGTREFLAFCNSLPGKPVLVQIEDFKSDTPVYKDNYLEVKYQQDVQDYFKNIAADVFSDAIVHYEPSRLSVSDNLTKDTSFAAFYGDSTTFLVVYVEVNETNYSSEAQFADFFSRLAGSEGDVMVSVIVVKDEVYGTLKQSDLNLLTHRKEDVASAYAEMKNGQFQFDLPEREA